MKIPSWKWHSTYGHPIRLRSQPSPSGLGTVTEPALSVGALDALPSLLRRALHNIVARSSPLLQIGVAVHTYD